ncbi:hypothetical protein OCL88_08260 [Paenarthrobacter sp. PAE-2]|uniref:hypothetical protein n=1 Tax=Paenarthrobacter sp. PAE-2 TaxID=2982532 RepID=UPI0022310BFB|nr:hypothetical protein [Paenarthrobacter sp. PAE-2]MCW3766465.1 hypothetical protein [Paenarthrobacter sp. PAE-2]
MGHIVTATLIVAKTGDTERYFDKGAILPTSVSAEEKKRLVAAGLVKYEKDASSGASGDAAAAKAAADAAAKEAAEAKAKADADKTADTK